MNDEKYVFFQEVKEKKVTGYSARKQRSHCGKGGRVKFPSDYLTKKELKNMSGECKSFRLNSPMEWHEFKSMPEDLQFSYIKAIKEKYDPSIGAIAKMMGIDRGNLSKHLKSLGFEKGERGHNSWDKEGFAEWCFGTPKTEESQSVQEEVKEEIPVEVAEVVQTLSTEELRNLGEVLSKDSTEVYAIPESGSLTFTGNPVTILNTLGNLLSYRNVSLSVNWCVVDD